MGAFISEVDILSGNTDMGAAEEEVEMSAMEEEALVFCATEGSTTMSPFLLELKTFFCTDCPQNFDFAGDVLRLVLWRLKIRLAITIGEHFIDPTLGN